MVYMAIGVQKRSENSNFLKRYLQGHWTLQPSVKMTSVTYTEAMPAGDHLC